MKFLLGLLLAATSLQAGYKSKLKCSKIEEIVANVPDGAPHVYCDAAQLLCKRLEQQQQVSKDIKADISGFKRRYKAMSDQAAADIKASLNKELTYCELAILYYQPDYYAEKVQSPN